MNKAIGILGGTFDPIHYGHLRLAQELLSLLDLEKIHFIPCKQPVHRTDTLASASDRLSLLKLACQPVQEFVVDEREILRDSPSYMIDTLRSLRKDYPQHPLVLIVGIDVFLQLPSWHEWQDLLKYAHIVVVSRPGFKFIFEDELKKYTQVHKLADVSLLQQISPGGIYIQSITLLEISATMIRSQLAAGFSPRFLLPDQVLAYISEHNLYKNRG